MTSDVLRIQEEEGVLTLLLNRPEKRNALNAETVEALHRAFQEAEGRDSVRVVVIRGEGPDFCAGADLSELEGITAMGEEESHADAMRLGNLLLRMRRHPRPVVAAVHGRALAGGCGLATACDLILAADSAELGYPEIHIGFVPAMVMAILRRKIGEGRAFQLVSLGRRITAREAQGIGLVSEVFPAEGFDEYVRRFVRDLASRPAEALTLTKRLLYEQGDLTLEDGIRRGAEVNVQARRSEACRAGVRAFLERGRGGSS